MRLTLGMDGLYGQDSYEYYRFAEVLRNYILTGTSPGDYFWPVAYPLVGAFLSIIVPDVSLALQIISAFSLSLTTIFVIKIIRLIHPLNVKASNITGILCMLSPFMLRFGMSVMADMFALAMFMMGTYYILSFSKKKNIGQLIFAGFLFSLSFMSRYGVAIIMIPLVIYASVTFFKTKQKWYWISIILIVSLIPILPHYLIRKENVVDFIGHDWLKTWSPVNFLKRSFTTADGTEQNPFPNVLYAFLGMFHPRYFGLAFLFIIVGLKRFKWIFENKLLLISVILYVLFLSGIPFQNNRFLLPAFPFFMILLYGPVQYFFEVVKKKWSAVIVSAIITLQLFFFGLSFKKVVMRYALEQKVLKYVTSNKVSSIYTMDIDVSLKGRGYSGTIYNIFTQYYREVDTNAIIIFNTAIFPKQWEGKKPMENWDHFSKNYELKEIHSFDSEWKVYAFK